MTHHKKFLKNRKKSKKNPRKTIKKHKTYTKNPKEAITKKYCFAP
jgi:hypothetical protein